MNKYAEELANGLTASVDYIAFTVTERMSVLQVVELMGFEPDDFIQMPKGGFGYKKQLKNEESGISILYDGADDMGIHVNATGKAVAPLLEHFAAAQMVRDPFDNMESSPVNESVLGLFFSKIMKVGQFTRLDAAIDDHGGKFFSPPRIFELYEAGQVISKWRTVRRNDRRKAPRDCDGYTLYFGSRESALMLRIYDKKLEQNKKKKPGDDGYIEEEWYRWELEFKEERANEFANLIIDGSNLGAIIVGVLAYYLRIVNLDDSNKSRCSNLALWDQFKNNVAQLRLSAQKKVKTVYDKLAWLDGQVAPTLATLLLLYNFDTNVFAEIAQKNKHRISKSDWELIRQHAPDVYDLYHLDEEDVVF